MFRIFPGFLSCSLLIVFLIPAWSQGNHEITLTTNLQKDAALSGQAGLPILLMISQDHCLFCVRLKQEVLQPMQISGDYTNKIVIREILIDMPQQITNFQGQLQDAKAFAHGYGVHITPTLLLLDPMGNELTQRIVGINTVEMLSFYLDTAIDKANEKMQDNFSFDGKKP